MQRLSWRSWVGPWLFGLVLASPAGAADDRNLAPGFTALPADARVAVFPVDVELFSISAGGVAEPRADWTAAARQHMTGAVKTKIDMGRLSTQMVADDVADEFAEQVGLHAAVARAIALHHSVGGVWALPSKAGQLSWSFADAMQPVAQRTSARYGLFMWVRDSYASAERKAAMVVMAVFGIGLSGGSQIGYASLVDLDTGRVVWFNRLARASGDLREAESADESIEALLSGLPLPR